MQPQTLYAFFDELTKLSTAGDLMTPAVVSDSAVVSGPPATPFARRRGYKRLEQISHISKEAGLGRDMKAWVLKRHRSMKRVIKPVQKAVDNTALKAYTKLPGPMQRALTDPSFMDPSDARVGAAAQVLKRTLGGG